MSRARFQIISLAILTMTLFLFQSSALAENRAGGYYLSPSVGGVVFDDDLNLDDGPAYGLTLGKNLTEHWGAELSGHYLDSEINSTGESIDSYLYRLEGLYNFLPQNRLIPYLAAGLGGITFDPDKGDTDTDFVLAYGLGFKFFATENVALRADARHFVAMEAPDHNYLFTGGIDFLFGGEKPAPAPAPKPVDSDGDGIIDARDKCPGTERGTAVDQDGCPRDSDGDGVIDTRDKCPGTEKGIAVDQDGCPRDSDGDGVIDARDKCPGTKKGIAVDQDGCPRDSDGDGVIDARDKCPDTDKGIMVDTDGCAQTLTLEIEFDVNKAQIKPEHADELARAAEFIRQFSSPQVLIIGHTDSQGNADYNKDLSLRRAQSVRQYLINEHDLASEHLVARGMGEERPVATNDTAEGRQENRRVEITCCAVVME